MKFPKSTIVIALLVTAVGFWPVNKIGSEFIPPLDEGDLMYMPSTYPGISIGKARELLQQTDKLIRGLLSFALWVDNLEKIRFVQYVIKTVVYSAEQYCYLEFMLLFYDKMVNKKNSS